MIGLLRTMAFARAGGPGLCSGRWQLLVFIAYFLRVRM
jgi:hypothetical protein